MRQMELPFLSAPNKRVLPEDIPSQVTQKRAKIESTRVEQVIDLEKETQDNTDKDGTKVKSLNNNLGKNSNGKNSQITKTSVTSTQLSEIDQKAGLINKDKKCIITTSKNDKKKKNTKDKGPRITMEERHRRKLQKDEEAKKRKAKREKEAEEKRAKREKEALEKKEKREKEIEERRIRKAKEIEEKRVKKERLAEERRLKKEKKEEEKEERKRKFEEERRRKKEELEEKKRIKEEAKKKKEEEKLRKLKLEEEKRKKQSITNFFHVKATKNSSKIATTNLVETQKESNGGKDKSDFERFFLSFYVKPNTRLIKQEVDLTRKNSLEQFIKNAENGENVPEIEADLNKFLQTLASKELISDSDLKSAYKKAGDVAQKMNLGLIKDSQEEFRKVPRVFLQFYENIKVPYCGTSSYTIFDLKESISINPFVKIVSKQGPSINYEYDSDLEESEDEGDGEDIDLENDDDDDDDEEEDDTSSVSDIEGFVEKDGNDSQSSTDSKQKILGPLKPETRWLGQTLPEDDAFGKYFQHIKVEKVQARLSFPIDPFKNYWQDLQKNDIKDNDDHLNSIKLEADTQFGNLPGTNSIQSNVGVMKVRKKTITKEEDVKKLVEFITKNSNYTLGTLTELLQKQIFTQYSRSLVRNSIKHFASFDKKQNMWVLNSDATSAMAN